jgi:hypothetical protein
MVITGRGSDGEENITGDKEDSSDKRDAMMTAELQRADVS